MPFHIVRNDITKMKVDAVVNPANETLLGGGGVDGAIHKAAGPKLLQRCRRLGGCRPGEAKLTPGYELPARWIIHTVGPVWQGGGRGEEEILRACYHNALELAKAKRCKSLAFPLISAGAFGYPREAALATATDCIRQFLESTEMEVYLVVFDETSFRLSHALEQDIREYIDSAYAAARCDVSNRPGGRPRADANAFSSGGFGFVPALGQRAETKPLRPSREADREELFFSGDQLSPGQPSPQIPAAAAKPAPAAGPSGAAKASGGRPSALREAAPAASAAAGGPKSKPRPGKGAPAGGSLRDALAQMDESFSQMLLRKIDEKGITDAACYKKANVDRKLFSKIRGDIHYRPSKVTAVAFAIALELPMEETRDLLMKAGFALSHSSKFDIIIEYFILHGNYNIYEINEALFAFDQVLLGC